MGEPRALANTDWNRSRFAILSRLGPQAAVLWSMRRMLPTAMIAAMMILSASLLLTIFAREASRHRSNMIATDAPRRMVETPVVEPTVDAGEREFAPWVLERTEGPWLDGARRDTLVVPATYSPSALVPSAPFTPYTPASTYSAATLPTPPLVRPDPFADLVRPAATAFERP